MCVPWELNPQPFTLIMQCSTTEPQEQCSHRCQNKSHNIVKVKSPSSDAYQKKLSHLMSVFKKGLIPGLVIIGQPLLVSTHCWSTSMNFLVRLVNLVKNPPVSITPPAGLLTGMPLLQWLRKKIPKHICVCLHFLTLTCKVMTDITGLMKFTDQVRWVNSDESDAGCWLPLLLSGDSASEAVSEASWKRVIYKMLIMTVITASGVAEHEHLTLC